MVKGLELVHGVSKWCPTQDSICGVAPEPSVRGAYVAPSEASIFKLQFAYIGGIFLD